MTYSQVSIYNLALTNLGISATIQNTSQTDVKTQTLNRLYDVALDQVLKDFDWNFARVYRELTLTGNDPENPNYSYEFDYPNDCLAAREIVDVDKTNFEVCVNTSGTQVINVNLEEVTLRYTKRITNEAAFPPEFVMALSWYLAALAAPTVIGSLDKAKQAMQTYTVLINQAKVSNANEGYENNPDEASWIEDRTA